MSRILRLGFFSVSIRSASGSYPGASSTSTKLSPIARAVSTSTGRLNPITPPKADLGSVAKDSR